MFREPPSELLAIVIDARLVQLREAVPRQSAKRPQQPHVQLPGKKETSTGSPAFPVIWDSLLVLCRAHAALATEQRVLLLGAHSRRAAVLASGLCRTIDWEAARRAASAFFVEEGAAGTPVVSVALSKVLCHANRVRHDAGIPDLPARVLFVDGSSGVTDFAAQGTALTSGAFAAKAAGVPVDCLSLGAEEPALLRQVAILTGGKHIALPPGGQPQSLPEVLVPTLLFHFVPGIAARKELNATEDFQNLAAICHCHGEALEIAYVCSCCLAIYCGGSRAICAVCRTRFRQDHTADPLLSELDLASR